MASPGWFGECQNCHFSISFLWSRSTLLLWKSSGKSAKRELDLLLYERLDAGLPVAVETVDVTVEEGQTVGEPLFQHPDFLILGFQALVQGYRVLQIL